MTIMVLLNLLTIEFTLMFFIISKKQLEPRLVNHKKNLYEAIDLKLFYAQYQDIISNQPFRGNYQGEEWDEWVANSKAIKIEDGIYLININYKLGCDRFTCDFTSNHYLFQYDGKTLRLLILTYPAHWTWRYQPLQASW